MVYKNFEKNYNTYRLAWVGDAEAVEPELDAAAAAATTSAATTAEALATRATSTKATAAHAST
jgi:hypothetical protein